jgi:hypothetical protein
MLSFVPGGEDFSKVLWLELAQWYKILCFSNFRWQPWLLMNVQAGYED